MAARFQCQCGMAFTVADPGPGRPVVCPACGTIQESPGRSAASAPTAPPPPQPIPSVEPDRPTVRCPDCDALNSTEDVICGMCGRRLSVDVLTLGGEAASPEASDTLSEDVEFLEEQIGVLAGGDEKPRRATIRYEGEEYVHIVRLVLRTLIRPRQEMETLVTFLSYRDMVWKLAGMFLIGVAGLWLAEMRYPGLPLVSGFTLGGRLPLKAAWYIWLGMAFSSAALVATGLTVFAAFAGMVTGHGWRLGPLALAFLFVVSLVNMAHLLLLPIGWVWPGGVLVVAWGLLLWEVLLTTFVINKVLDCEAILSVIIALVICAVTVHFYNRVYALTSRLVPGEGRPAVGAIVAGEPDHR